jgi:riboflavin synthase
VFTGLVTAVGTVHRVTPADGGLQLVIDSPYRGLSQGESIAVDGACLTIETSRSGRFRVHVITTSLARTAFGGYAAGRRVNLERALRASDRLGGHLVQGHVDGVGTVRSVTAKADATVIDLDVPPAVADVSVLLGSIALDGVSLTVNAIPRRDVIQVSLIPFTLQHTTLGERRPGDRVHLEGDTIGKYVRQLAGAHFNDTQGR